jgi:hypothetical protein
MVETESEILIYNNLNENSSKIIQDSRIKISLKEHQKTAIKAMIDFEDRGIVKFTREATIQHFNIIDKEERENSWYYNYYNRYSQNIEYKNISFEIESNYGILADKVGSGKTFMTMGLIAYKQIPSNRDKIISSSIYSVIKYKCNDTPIKTNLILVPHNICRQWSEAFKFSTLKTYTVAKHTDVSFIEFSENIFANQQSSDKPDFTELNCIEYYDVIIMSATMFDSFYDKFRHVKWARIIIDEIISIKNMPTDLEFNCNFLWFLTATPSGIKNIKRQYIRTLISSTSNYIINSIIIKNDDNYIDTSMNLPNINQILIKCLTPKELRTLTEYISEDIINMINAGDIQNAITRLNCNVETSDNILEVVTNKIKKELHNKRNELEYEQKRIPDDKKAHEDKIKKIEQKIINLEGKYSGLEERLKSFKENNCPICLNEFESPTLTNCCNNLFCLTCLAMCDKCPLCRQNVDIKHCTVIHDKKIDNTDDNKKERSLCSKIDNLVTIINKNPKGKFLLFSNYDGTFENVNKRLNDEGITNNKLVGSSAVINSVIKRFTNGDIRVLMLNALNYGSGLNLQMATDIIIYHQLDMELETQVIGRAQRLGRSNSLNVYYLFNEGEKINCTNPTLSLDIFSDDTTMLEKFLGYEDKDKDKDKDKEREKDKDKETEKEKETAVKKKTKTKAIKDKSTSSTLSVPVAPTVPATSSTSSASSTPSNIVTPTETVTVTKVKKVKKAKASSVTDV